MERTGKGSQERSNKEYIQRKEENRVYNGLRRRVSKVEQGALLKLEFNAR